MCPAIKASRILENARGTITTAWCCSFSARGQAADQAMRWKAGHIPLCMNLESSCISQSFQHNQLHLIAMSNNGSWHCMCWCSSSFLFPILGCIFLDLVVPMFRVHLLCEPGSHSISLYWSNHLVEAGRSGDSSIGLEKCRSLHFATQVSVSCWMPPHTWMPFSASQFNRKGKGGDGLNYLFVQWPTIASQTYPTTSCMMMQKAAERALLLRRFFINRLHRVGKWMSPMR